jgi:hypothetical protein
MKFASQSCQQELLKQHVSIVVELLDAVGILILILLTNYTTIPFLNLRIICSLRFQLLDSTGSAINYNPGKKRVLPHSVYASFI